MKFDIKEGVKGLIFDLDGTLADTMPYHYEGWKIACSKFGVHLESDFLKKYLGSPGKIIAKEVIRTFNLEGKVTIEQIVNEKNMQFIALQHKVKPIDPVVALVKRYYGVLPMAVGTGGHRDAVEKTLEITGLKKYFDIIVTANDVDKFKPHPETFLKCAELMGVEPRYIEVFEDADFGLEAARIAGMIGTDIRSWYDYNW